MQLTDFSWPLSQLFGRCRNCGFEGKERQVLDFIGAAGGI
jgi:hypothetical protein